MHRGATGRLNKHSPGLTSPSASTARLRRIALSAAEAGVSAELALFGFQAVVEGGGIEPGHDDGGVLNADAAIDEDVSEF